MYTDYQQSSDKIILDLVNYHNHDTLAASGLYPIRGRDIIIGQPVPVTGRRTKVLITPKSTAGFVHPFWFTYNRVDLQRLLLFNSDRLIRLRDDGVYKVSDIIGLVNNRWQVSLGAFDYIDSSVNLSQYDATLSVVADPRSLVWVGSIDLFLSRAVALSDVIVRRDLDGFAIGDLSWQIRNTDLGGFARV